MGHTAQLSHSSEAGASTLGAIRTLRQPAVQPLLKTMSGQLPPPYLYHELADNFPSRMTSQHNPFLLWGNEQVPGLQDSWEVCNADTCS